LAAGRPGQGTFIEGTLAPVPLRDQRTLRRRLDRWLADASAAGLDEDGVGALISTALHDAYRGRGEAVS
jgi:GntR family transcriptional regulator